MHEKINIDVMALQGFVAQYKAGFIEHRLGSGNEIYKWKAVKCFQDSWDIDAPDFLTMLRAAMAQTGNLLANINNFPKSMLEDFAKVVPEDVRNMFRALFDENVDVKTRADAFAKKAAELRMLNPAWKQDYQTPNAISTYLWLRYPDKYYIYKYSVIKDNALKLCDRDIPTGKLNRMVFCFALYDAICDELAKDTELTAMSKESLSADCYPDDALKTLTVDLGYFVSTHNIPVPQSDDKGAQLKEPIPINKNSILYGAPGTGKTYSTVLYAVSIIEEKPLDAVKTEDYSAVFARYLKHKEDGLVAFTTFHQSYGYEEFIEGIRPVVTTVKNPESGRDIEYEVHAGVFKEFCNKVQKENDASNGEIDNFAEAADKLREALDEHESLVMQTIQGRSITVRQSTDGSGWLVDISVPSRPRFYNYEQLHNVYQGNKGVPAGGHDNYRKAVLLYMKSHFGLKDYVPPQILGESNVKPRNHVFIIDEINRGNISKIFGELITLIEPAKRVGAKEQLYALLPYSGQTFGVPENVYIIGTMNTADRSIALLDTALRRRFSFVEMKPDSATLTDVLVDVIDIGKMLDTLNMRITVLLDREHTIGHSYLLPLKADATIERLAEIFANKIVPLLQEYFHDDYEKIQLVLGDNQKPDDSTRFVIRKTDAVKLFGQADLDLPEYYEINGEAFKQIDAYAYM